MLSMSLGGTMLEKVLKRLCPCYFGWSEENDLSDSQTLQNGDFYLQETPISNGRSKSVTVMNNWKDALNIVQPQPVYALPIDAKRMKKRNKKTLLQPPLYWKKTMKNLYRDGPPVFQQFKDKKFTTGKKKNENKKYLKQATLKQSLTTENITSLPSNTTINLKWLKSQSLGDLSRFYGPVLGKSSTAPSDAFPSVSSIGSPAENNDFCLRYPDWDECRVIPDTSQGVILFTAAYFSKKKVCIISINRLENLSPKGRDKNSYYTVIKLAVLPSEKYVKCSRILSNCSSPEVKQEFSFSVKELSRKVLRFSVFDASLQKQHEAVGHALLTLEDIISDQPKKYRIQLYRRTQPHTCPGNLALSLRYLSDEDKFIIIAEKGRNLSLQKDRKVKLNTYVKATMYAYGIKTKTKKSIVVFNCRDPNYNSMFTFAIRHDQIDHVSVCVAVRLKGFVNDQTIGRLNFGPFFYAGDGKLTSWGQICPYVCKREKQCLFLEVL